MEIKVVKDYLAISQQAAHMIASLLQKQKAAVLGLPTGNTPLGMYSELVQLYYRGLIDFSCVQTFNLDEYVGLPAVHPQSYHAYMREHLFSKVNLLPKNCHLPRGDAQDLAEECSRYEALIDQAGGMDLVILGIGRNGHIGFNEPGSKACSKTRVVSLAQSTIQTNAKHFSDMTHMPKQAITMGLETILSKSKQILLLASGQEKAEIICKLLNQDNTDTRIPASLLKQHQHVTIVLDEAAAKLVLDNITI